MRGLEGGATTGTENALLLFTNASATICTLTGYPRVTLRRDGAVLGSPAQDATATPKTITLASGARAQAVLMAATTCQANESDTARLRLPGRAGYVDIALQVRGCTLTVGPIEASS